MISSYFNFRLPTGQSLFVVGSLELMLTFSRIFETYSIYIYKDGQRQPFSEFGHHLDNLEWIQLGLETFKIFLVLMFWIGGLILGKNAILKAWIYITIILEVILQLLIWTVEYHDHLLQHFEQDMNTNSSSDIKAIPILKLCYSGLITLLIRIYLIIAVYIFLWRKSSKNSSQNSGNEPTPTTSAANSVPSIQNSQSTESTSDSKFLYLAKLPSISSIQIPFDVGIQRPAFLGLPTVPEDIDLYPVGLGVLHIFKFYYKDLHRLAKLLLTIDLSWGLCRLLEKEFCQIIFGNVGMGEGILPLSRGSTPIMTEERIIRSIRIIFDFVFLRNLHNGKPPLTGSLIIPKLIEIFVSFGILLFLRIADYDSYPHPVFTLFYIIYILDILFRIFTFVICYKAYGDFLCQRHRDRTALVVASKLKRAQSLISNK